MSKQSETATALNCILWFVLIVMSVQVFAVLNVGLFEKSRWDYHSQDNYTRIDYVISENFIKPIYNLVHLKSYLNTFFYDDNSYNCFNNLPKDHIIEEGAWHYGDCSSPIKQEYITEWLYNRYSVWLPLINKSKKIIAIIFDIVILLLLVVFFRKKRMLWTEWYWEGLTFDKFVLDMKKKSDVMITTTDIWGNTPLMYASSSSCDAKIISYLIKLCESNIVNYRNLKGETALFFSCKNYKKSITETLLKSGASVYIKNLNGVTPLMTACVKANIDVVDLLLKYKANLECIDKNGNDSLMYAVMSNSADIVAKLIKTNINKDKVNNKKETALMLACKGFNVDIVKLLIKYEQNLNKTNNEKQTILILACKYGSNQDIVSLLLDYGVDAKRKDCYGKTAIDYAQRNSFINNSEAFWKLNEIMYE